MTNELKNIKVLIADDELDILEIMVKSVAKEGYTVIPAHDGLEAWEKIQSENPDIILLDVTMPGMSGLEVLKNLRENPPTEKWQPVVIISALGEMKDLEAGFSGEADHYITKPCQMHDIIKGIRLMNNLIPLRKSRSEA